MRVLGVLPGFHIVGHNPNYIRYAEMRLQELLQEKEKKCEKKEPDINFKRTECVIVNKKDNLKYELRIEETKLKQVEKCK